jgi:colicin import membrane protein
MIKNLIVVLLLVLAAGCSSNPGMEASPPPMDPSRTVSEQVCIRTLKDDGGNLLCQEVTEAERRAMIAEKERQAKARKEAAERAERERLERERAEQLAREEAARKQRAAEEARLVAEAARRAQEEHERQMRALAEARAREAAALECRRLEQERSDGRALLAKFVAKYGTDEEFKAIAGQITAFLDKPRKVKPCPPA